MAVKKRKQKQTLREFRAWLEGVEELQLEDWAPNKEQWTLIRSRIDGIKESSAIEKIPPVVHESIQSQPNQYPVIQQPSLIAPLSPGGVPAGEVEMSSAARQMLIHNGGTKTKTPDMDTSDGNVDSPFA